MRRVPTMIAATERERWLTELAAAVDEAQVLLWRIAVLEGDNSDAKELYSYLEAIRAEIECLRPVQKLARQAIGPDWMELFDWEQLGSASPGPTRLAADRRRPRTPRGKG